MKKPDYLPLYRDGDRLLASELVVAKKRIHRRHPGTGRRAMHLLAWPNARWWRSRAVASADDLAASRHPGRDQSVFDAWQRLGRFRRWDAESFADALHLLIETPAVEIFGAEPVPERDGDPRLALADRERLREWLVKKSRFWDEACAMLATDGRLTESDARRLRRHRPDEHRCVDPRALVHFRCTADLFSLRWEERTVRSILSWFRGGSLREVRRADAFAEEWLAEGWDRPALQRFLLDVRAESAAPWLARASFVRTPGRRRFFLEHLRNREARQRSPHRISFQHIMRLDKLARRLRRGWIEVGLVFEVVERGLDPAVLDDYLDLADALPGLAAHLELPDAVRCRPDVETFIDLHRKFERAAARRGENDTRTWLLGYLWGDALKSPAMNRELEKPVRSGIPEEALADWVDLLDDLHGETSSEEQFERFAARMRRSVLGEAPEDRARKVEALHGIATGPVISDSFQLFELLAPVLSTIARECKEVPRRAIHLLRDLIEIANDDQRWSLAHLPRSAIKRIADATRSDDDCDAIKAGARIWLRLLPEADLSLHFRRPKRFLDALRSLGRLPEADAESICVRLRHHPGFGVDPLRIDLREACLLFDEIVRVGETDPVPPKLRLFAGGCLRLRPVVVEHYREEFAAGLADYQIDLLRAGIRRVEDRYRADRLDPHTVHFLVSLGTRNRRALKKFLLAIRIGDRDYRDSHPANRDWLAQHRQLAIDPWIQRGALPFPVSLPGIGKATIQLEDDPQEELKMGSYPGTCLAPGGCNQHGAVANTLDINKRVAYLRDAGGRVVARQLLAISEEEQLVPFHVYETQRAPAGNACERAFHRFDRRLARLLRLPLWKKGDYRIRPLLAKNWYDDGAWPGLDEQEKFPREPRQTALPVDAGK